MGGGDVPASGFALYLDRLMNLVKPEVTAGPIPQRIMVRVQPGDTDALKEAFNIAGSLREAGYIAELDLDGQEPAGLRWIVDVQSQAPQFTLVDRVESSRVEARTVREVLKLLEAKGGYKDSPA